MKGNAVENVSAEKRTAVQKGDSMIDWDKQFPIVTLCRADLRVGHFSTEEIETLTDEDMQEIAKRLKEDLHPTFEQLTFIVRLYFAERKR